MSKKGGRPKGTGGQAKDLSRDEVKRIDKCLAGTKCEDRDRALFYLGLGSGMRIGELVSLRVKDVWSGRAVLDRVVIEKHSAKSKRSRAVFLTRQVRQVLKAYLEGCDELEAGEPLFPSLKRPKSKVSVRAATAALDRAFKAAGVKGASSHSLRRTHANELRRKGVDLKIIQEQLGHASLATTERYFRVDPVEAKEAIGSLRF